MGALRERVALSISSVSHLLEHSCLAAETTSEDRATPPTPPHAAQALQPIKTAPATGVSNVVKSCHIKVH